MTGLGFILAGLAGAGLAMAYFGLLWLSVCWLTEQRRGWLFVGAALARMALVAAALGLFLAASRPLAELAAAGLGFFVVRLIVTRTMDVKTQER
jgi:F1F0 ATPase subunit 2